MTAKTFEIKEILNHGLENSLKSDVYVIPDNLPAGKWVAQGDLNFTVIDEIPSDAELIEKPSLQLAPGNSKGSRHCLDSLANVKVYKVSSSNPLFGYYLEFGAGATTVTHPEHKHQVWKNNTVFVTYQRQHAEELKRIED